VLNRFSNVFDLNNVYFASGMNYPDALSSSALAALTSSPIVLVDNNRALSTKEYVKANINKMNYKHATGGRGAIPDNVFLWLFN